MQTDINQTSHLIKKDIIKRAYSQLREFLRPRVCPSLPDAELKTRQEEEEEDDHRKKYLAYSWDCADNQASQVHEIVLKYTSKGKHQKEAQNCNKSISEPRSMESLLRFWQTLICQSHACTAVVSLYPHTMQMSSGVGGMLLPFQFPRNGWKLRDFYAQHYFFFPTSRPISQLEFFICLSMWKSFTIPCHWGQSNTDIDATSTCSLQPQSCGVHYSLTI